MGCSNNYSGNTNLNEKIKEEKKIDLKRMSPKETKNLFTIKFESEDAKINHYIICNETDMFKNIANKVFEEKIEFKEYGNIFLIRENRVDENKSLKENQIKDQDIIIVKKKEDDMDSVEEKKLKNLAEEIKDETNIDVIIFAKDTKNIVFFRFFSLDKKIKYYIISHEDSIFNEIISKVYELNPEYNHKKYYFFCNDNESIINEYKTVKENHIKNDYLTILAEKKYCINSVFHSDIQSGKEKEKLNSLADKLKKETNTDVITLARDTKNLISLKFLSDDQNINCYILCNKNAIFNTVANKVFEENKKFREYGIIFLCNGKEVNVYKSLEENDFKDRDLIIVNKRREDPVNDIYDSQSEERKIKNLAEKIKKDSNIDVIILAKDTKDLIFVKIQSYNNQIEYYILCKETDLFNSILNKVFERHPELRDYEFMIQCNGVVLNGYKTLKVNGIKDGNIIYLNEEKKLWLVLMKLILKKKK